MIENLFFDFGGTLDTHGIHWFDMFADAYISLLPESNKHRVWDAYVAVERRLERENVIQPDDNLLTTLRKKMTLHATLLGIDNARLEATLERLYAVVQQRLEASRKMLERLRMAYSNIAVVSNYYGNLSAILRETGILPLVDIVADSTCVGARKPDVRIYRYALEKIGGVPERTVMVGDSLKNDIHPCQQLGMQTIWLNPSDTQQLPLPQATASTRQHVEQLLTGAAENK